MTKVMELFQRSEAPLPAEADLPIRLTRKAPAEAAKLLQRYPDDVAARALALVNPALTVDILALLPEERRQRIAAADLSWAFSPSVRCSSPPPTRRSRP